MKLLITKKEFEEAVARWGESDANDWLSINDKDGTKYKYKNSEDFIKYLFDFIEFCDPDGSLDEIINFSNEQIFIEEDNQTTNIIDYIDKNHIHLMKIYCENLLDNIRGNNK